MAFAIYGSKRTPIGYDEFLVRCPCCEAHNWADAVISANYFHFYWVPIFPHDKEVYLICQKCGMKREGLAFDSTLISDFENVKRKHRYPWYTYFGVLVVGSLVAIAIITTIFDRD